MEPPSLVLIGAAALLAGYALWLRSTPVAMVVGVWPCIGIAAGIWILLDYSVRLVRCAIRRTLRPGLWRWVPMPLLLIVGVSGWHTRWPLYLRFELDRPAFEATAERWLAQAPATQPYVATSYLELHVPQNPRGPVGSFSDVEGIVFKDERIVFFVTDGFFRAFWGFVYDPDGRALSAPAETGQEWQTRPFVRNWKTFLVSRP
ncbi:MAG: hypothetical protein AB1716_10155 [Planctomycetota bacterium]